MQYRTRGTCSTMINLTLDENHVIQDVRLYRQMQRQSAEASAKLVIGQRAEDVIPKIDGIQLRLKNTSVLTNWPRHSSGRSDSNYMTVIYLAVNYRELVSLKDTKSNQHWRHAWKRNPRRSS